MPRIKVGKKKAGTIIRDIDALAKIIRALKGQGKTVVFTNGCFDLLHVGHIRCLLDASGRGEYPSPAFFDLPNWWRKADPPCSLDGL